MSNSDPYADLFLVLCLATMLAYPLLTLGLGVLAKERNRAVSPLLFVMVAFVTGGTLTGFIYSLVFTWQGFRIDFVAFIIANYTGYFVALPLTFVLMVTLMKPSKRKTDTQTRERIRAIREEYVNDNF